MATLEDKILGNPIHNYCSSSSSEDESEDENSDNKIKSNKAATEENAPLPEVNSWSGTSSNTGPKGVIQDWQRYKQLEQEKRFQNEKEKNELMKKLTLTVQSALDEEREKAALEDQDLAELLNDDFILDFQKKRMKELLQQTNHNLKFGSLLFLNNGQEFLDAIDLEEKTVMIIVHIYENNSEICRNMNECLKELCKSYISVKFCCMIGSKVGMTSKFKVDGVPALLVYKGGNLIGNFVKLGDVLGDDFIPEDVEEYLVEHGILQDKTCVPLIIRNTTNDQSDSD